MKKTLIATTVSALALLASAPGFAQLAGTATVTNNYVWRGLTQTMNDAAIQGGVKYTAENGAYVGTWISNVSFDAGDAYSYEHDLFAGYTGKVDAITYDVGYLYYNYGKHLGANFGEVYGTVTIDNLSLGANFLVNEQLQAAPGKDFGAFSSFYLQGNYNIPLNSGAAVALHVGYHRGDFMEAFNGVTKSYVDYSVGVAKNGFSFTLGGTNLHSDDDGNGIEDYASMPARNNDQVKFVVAYTTNIEL